MLNKVEVRTDQGALLTLSPSDPSNGFTIENIDGLGPVKANLVSSTFSQMDGEQYQSAKREKRNIKFKLGLRPDFTVDWSPARALRKRLYGFFMPKASVNMRFFVQDGPDELVVNITGMVETFEPDQFTDEPMIDISILCFKPDFVDNVENTLSSTTTFLDTEQTINYDGEVESGIVFKLFVDRNISDFTIYHRPPDDIIRQLDFAVTDPLVDGDMLTISTIPGDKYATLTRASVESSILWGISPQASWISLQPGTNKIRVDAEGAPIPYEIVYSNKYGGL